jgi:hypothetical protein
MNRRFKSPFLDKSKFCVARSREKNYPCPANPDGNLGGSFFMTPREVTKDETDSPENFAPKPFTLQELVLHGKPNWPAAVFFACVAALHAYIAIHSFRTSLWEGVISALLMGCFVVVAFCCAMARSVIAIRPRQQKIHLHGGVGRLAIDRDTLWHSRRGPRSRVEILCNGEEIPCPPTTIPRQQALYLALVMHVPLIKICDDSHGDLLVSQRSESSRC